MFRVPPAKLILWVVLALPATAILWRFFAGEHPAQLIPSTGEWSAKLIIVALMLTPIARLLPGNSAVRWLLRHRRSVGVAAFAYALLHLLFYVLDMETFANIVAEFPAPAMWTAWVAFFCLVPPALASRDAAMRTLGRMWKTIQRLAYPAAILTLVHWLLVHDGKTEALLHFAPLFVLQLLRITRIFSPKPLERKIA